MAPFSVYALWEKTVSISIGSQALSIMCPFPFRYEHNNTSLINTWPWLIRTVGDGRNIAVNA